MLHTTHWFDCFHQEAPTCQHVFAFFFSTVKKQKRVDLCLIDCGLWTPWQFFKMHVKIKVFRALKEEEAQRGDWFFKIKDGSSPQGFHTPVSISEESNKYNSTHDKLHVNSRRGEGVFTFKTHPASPLTPKSANSVFWIQTVLKCRSRFFFTCSSLHISMFLFHMMIPRSLFTLSSNFFTSSLPSLQLPVFDFPSTLVTSQVRLIYQLPTSLLSWWSCKEQFSIFFPALLLWHLTLSPTSFTLSLLKNSTQPSLLHKWPERFYFWIFFFSNLWKSLWIIGLFLIWR